MLQDINSNKVNTEKEKTSSSKEFSSYNLPNPKIIHNERIQLNADRKLTYDLEKAIINQQKSERSRRKNSKNSSSGKIIIFNIEDLDAEHQKIILDQLREDEGSEAENDELSDTYTNTNKDTIAIKSLSNKKLSDHIKPFESYAYEYLPLHSEGNKANVFNIEESNHVKKLKDRKIFLNRDKNLSEGNLKFIIARYII